MAKRYINILLAESPDLAEFLVTFLPESTDVVQHVNILHSGLELISGRGDMESNVCLQSGCLAVQPTQKASTGVTTIACNCQECSPYGSVWPPGTTTYQHVTTTDPVVDDKLQATPDPKFMKPIFRFTNKANLPFPSTPSFQGYPIHCNVIPAVFNNQSITSIEDVVQRAKSSEYGIHENTMAPVTLNLVPGINTVTNLRSTNTVLTTSSSFVQSKRRTHTSTIAAQLSKPAMNSLNQQYVATIPPFSHAPLPTIEGNVDESRPQKRLPEAMLEALPPATKIPKLRNKPIREMESLKALTSKLKLACAEKKLETIKLALTCAEMRLHTKQKKAEESRAENNKISPEYATLFHAASNLTTDPQGAVRLTVSGIPFQIRDPKTQTMVQATARNLTSFPYIQKISVPGGETHNVSI